MELPGIAASLQQILNVPVSLYHGTDLMESFPAGHFFLPDITFTLLHKAALQSSHTHGVVISDDYVFYGFIRVAGTDSCIYVGPGLAFHINDEKAEGILDSVSLPTSRTEELVRCLRSSAPLRHRQFTAAITFVDSLINNIESAPAYLEFDQLCPERAPQPPIGVESPEFIEQTGDTMEKELLSFIENGDPEGMISYIRHMGDQPVGVPQTLATSGATLRSIFTLSAGLASRAAVRGGLDYDYSTSLYNNYLVAYENIRSYAEFNSLFVQMMTDFADRVSEVHTLGTDSPLVIQISREISRHVHEKYSLRDLAEDLHMSAPYLSTHFHNQTGRTLSTYINEVKVNEAKRLLKNRNNSIAKVSAMLGYSSQNYFQRVFLKMSGVTPNEYRNTTESRHY